MSQSPFLAGALLDEVYSQTNYAPVATIYIALLVSGVEVSGGSYARVGITNNVSNWPLAAGTPRSKSNPADIVFPTPTGGWGDVDEVRTYDAIVAGNYLHSGTFAPVTINTGASVKFLAGDLTIQAS